MRAESIGFWAVVLDGFSASPFFSKNLVLRFLIASMAANPCVKNFLMNRFQCGMATPLAYKIEPIKNLTTSALRDELVIQLIGCRSIAVTAYYSVLACAVKVKQQGDG